jgi:hypothetical protein
MAWLYGVGSAPVGSSGLGLGTVWSFVLGLGKVMWALLMCGRVWYLAAWPCRESQCMAWSGKVR